MKPNKYLLTDKYKKFLLNRVTVSPSLIEYLENCVANEEEATKYCFHKIMIHGWPDESHQLFDTMSTFFSTIFIPVHFSVMGDVTLFYVDKITLILKIIKLDFMFPYRRNMFSIDILLNDKTSMDFFGELLTIDDVISSIVSNRFSETCDLDLSDFCHDPEIIKKRICFYKLSLLSSFKILMLRMGRDTKSLNLSNNNIIQPPLDILNFFIKADLTSINLSNNNIGSITDLVRVSSKIEKLWIEGNPLCEEMDPTSYVKQVTIKFPRLTELDGVLLNLRNLAVPFIRNYASTPDDKTKQLVDTFLTLYFSHYDSPGRQKNIANFYDVKAQLSLSVDFTDTDDDALVIYLSFQRNIVNLTRAYFQRCVEETEARCHKTRHGVCMIHGALPATLHDPSTFTVDVLMHDNQSMVLVVDGICKQKSTLTLPEKIFQFRRTFVFIIKNNEYLITNELYHLGLATANQIAYSFKVPLVNRNVLQLIDPTPDEADAAIKVLQLVTQLKKSEIELRLKYHKWNIEDTLKELTEDLRSNRIMPELFLDDDFSDISSLLDEVD